MIFTNDIPYDKLTNNLKGTDDFPLIFSLIEDPAKDRYSDCIKYIDSIISSSAELSNDEVISFFNIRLPFFEIRIKLLIAEYLVTKFYIEGLRDAADVQPQEELSIPLVEVMERDKKRVDGPIVLSADEGQREFKRRKSEKERTLKYLSKINGIICSQDARNLLFQDYLPRTILNLHVNISNLLYNEKAPAYPLSVPVEKTVGHNGLALLRRSLVVTNTKKDFESLDEQCLQTGCQSAYLLETINNVIIFDSEGKRDFQELNYNKLTRLNEEAKGNIRRLFLITFDDSECSLYRSIRTRRRSIAAYYKQELSEKYTDRFYYINPAEIQNLLAIKRGKISIHPVKLLEETLGDFSELLMEREELKELVSIKMLNVYSACVDEDMRDMILNDIFNNPNSHLISRRTTIQLRELPTSVVKEIRQTLEVVLNIVVNKRIYSSIIQQLLAKDTLLLIPKVLYAIDEYSNKIMKVLNIEKANITTWEEYESSGTKNLVVFDYRDSGTYPFNIENNIFEIPLHKYENIHLVFISGFFMGHFTRKRYMYNKYLYKLFFKNIIRDKYYDKSDVKNYLRQLENEQVNISLYDEDNAYRNDDERQTIRVQVEGDGPKSYYPSKPFIAREQQDQHLRVLRADELLEENWENYNIQELSEIYSGLELFRVTKEEEEELNAILANYKLNKTELDKELWKVLLNRKARLKGVQVVYSEINATCNRANIHMVSFRYFQSMWLGYENDVLIPRMNKLFRIVCDYLELPRIYYRFMLKKRANQNYGATTNTRKMNSLVTHLVENGYFERHHDGIEKDDYKLLNEEFELEDVGIYEENFSIQILALVELLKENVKLKRIRKIDKVIHDS